MREVSWLAPCALAAALRVWHVDGPQQSYYTATVVSMLQSAHNFLYGSFDPGGLVMVDKPPVAFWVQALPVALLGPTDWAVVLPQVFGGVIAVGVLYALINAGFGRLAATVAASALAVFPAAVLVDTRNGPDGLLAFTLLLSAAAVLRATDTGRKRWVIAAAVLLGIAFNIKMLMAFVPVPAFSLYYLLAAKGPRRTRAGHMALGAVALLTTSLSWPVLVAMTPPDARPYVGSTEDNSIFTLIFGHNGVERFTSFIGPVRPPGFGDRPGGTPGFGQGPGAAQPAGPGTGPAPAAEGLDPLQIHVLFEGRLAALTGWLLTPGLALLAVLSLAGLHWRDRRSLPVGDRAPFPTAVLLWGGWLLSGTVVLGFARATASHPYYLGALGAPLAALLGIGVATLWGWLRQGDTGAVLRAAGLALIASCYGAWSNPALPEDARLGVAALLGAVTGATVLLAYRVAAWRRVVPAAVLATMACFLLAPATLVLAGASGNPGGRFGRPPGPGLANAPPRLGTPAAPVAGRELVRQVTRYIEDRADAGTRFAVVSMRADSVAPFIVAGVPAAALGGFSGGDPVLTPAEFEQMAARGEVRYFFGGGLGPGGLPVLRPGAPAGARGRATPAGPDGAGSLGPGQRAPALGPPALGPGRRPRIGRIEAQIRQTWEDISTEIGRPAGTLYRYPGAGF